MSGRRTLRTQRPEDLLGFEPGNAWIAYKPVPAVGSSPAELSSETQPGTRLFFMDPVDGAAADQPTFYLHNGVAIIDTAGNTAHPVSGLSYGADPFNPGPGIVANRLYTGIGPVESGNPPGIRTGGNYGPGAASPGNTQYRFPALGRVVYPDWYLGKRGRTLNLQTDLAAYKLAAPGWLADAVNLTLPGASAASGGVQLWGSYGPLTEPPFRVLDPEGWALAYRSESALWDNVVYQDLWLDGHTRGMRYRPVAEGGTKNAGSSAINAASVTGGTVRLQGLLLDGAPQMGMTGAASCTFDMFECVIVDSHGLISSNISAIDAHGSEASMVSIKSSILLQGGWRFSPRRVRDDWATFPAYVPGQAAAWGTIATTTAGVNVTAYHCDIAAPEGATLTSKDPVSGLPYWTRCGLNGDPISDTVRDRNAYFASPGVVFDSLSACGGSGWQFRNGARIERSTFFEGYVMLGALKAWGCGSPDGAAPLTRVRDVFVLNYAPGTAGHPGWGLQIGGGISDTQISGLIVSGAHHPLQNGSYFQSVGLETSSFLYRLPIRRVTIKNSVLDGGAGPAVLAVDGAAIPVHNPAGTYAVYAPNSGNNVNSLVRTGAYPVAGGYKCIQAAPAGTALTNTDYWAPATPDDTDGVGYSSAGAPGFVGCTLDASVQIISSRPRATLLSYTQQWAAPSTCDITINPAAPLHTTRAAYAAATGASGTERTLKTYMTDVLGWTVTSPSGMRELCDYVTGRTTGQPLHRGNWPAALRPLAITNYLRAGWAYPPLG